VVKDRFWSIYDVEVSSHGGENGGEKVAVVSPGKLAFLLFSRFSFTFGRSLCLL
jgi:hypothetical protein